MHKSSFMPMVLGYIPRSEGYIPLFFQGTIVMGTVVGRERSKMTNLRAAKQFFD
jgi:hypothetical protein